jgi:hypothetical protein
MTRLAPLALALAVLAPTAISSQRATRGPAAFPVRFADVTAAAKIGFVHAWTYSPDKPIVETLGSGVAWLDYDNDGFQDLFFVNGAPGSANALYHNNRDGTFTDVTRQAGLGGTSDAGARSYRAGVAVGDVDNDGDLDVYVTAFGPNVLYRNNGDGTFTDVTAAARVAGPPTEWSTSAGFFDFDRDGDLDLYVANYLDYRRGVDPYCGTRKAGYRMYCSPTVFDGQADRLYRNDGRGTFTDVSQAAGIANPAGKGLGIALCDIDGDADLDIYVANDQVRNFLYRNNGDGTFVDAAYGAGVGFGPDGRPQGGMGTDCADVSGNGLADLFVANFEQEMAGLYRNAGGGAFEDVSAAAGLRTSAEPVGFGTKLFDMDNDGDRDIYLTNGHVVDNVALYRPGSSFAQKDLIYENAGGGRFRDVSAQAGPAVQVPRIGRGLAVADFDNDGALDVVISTQGQAPDLLRNQGVRGRAWIEIRARGKASNRFGLGARVEINASGTHQTGEVNNVASYLSSSDLRLHFGLGAAKTIERISVRWPSGRTQVLTNVAVNQVLTIQEP